MFYQKKEICDYTVVKDAEDKILRVNCLGCPYGASLEDYEICMAKTIDKLLENEDVTRVILAEAYENEYGSEDTFMLVEIASLIKKFLKVDKLLSSEKLCPYDCTRCLSKRSSFLQKLIFDTLRKDPVLAYYELKREISLLDRSIEEKGGKCAECEYYFLQILEKMLKDLENTKLIRKAKKFMGKYTPGRREIYREIFTPLLKPNFMLTRYMATVPPSAEEVDSYYIGEDIEVRIYRLPEYVEYLYFTVPPEFQLPEDQYMILGVARENLASHKPMSAEFTKYSREYFEKVGSDLLMDLANKYGVSLSSQRLEKLTEILTRYTIGLGILEVIIADDKVQDIYINAPIGTQPIRVTHQDFGECFTNIIPTREDAEALASRFRLQSGRPLDEAEPVLDTEADTPGGRVRVCVITRNLSPKGLAFAFRRHRSKPWTLPLFIDNKMINPLAAGLLSFLVDGGRCILYAGPRGSGKTSMLSATIAEIMRKYRIITVEDTLEIPVDYFRQIGYNILSLKVRSIITKLESELPAEEGIRTALRLGDSCLIIGEVRSTEARALYEAMRVGALSNVVAGTIHGDDPYGVWDRVVNDLNVPNTSFKATDIIVMVSPIRSADGLHRYRRVVQITEVRKRWKNDPLDEGGFVDLMVYDAKKDALVPTDTLCQGDSEILQRIASRVKEWAGNWNAVWENIKLRAKIKETLVKYARKLNRRDILEASFVSIANDVFHLACDQVREEFGSVVAEEAYARWLSWLREELRR